MSILIAVAIAATLTWLASINSPARTHEARPSLPSPRDPGSASEPLLITDMLGGACQFGVVIASRVGQTGAHVAPKRS